MSHHNRWFHFRWKFRLFWCRYCHARMSRLFGGRLYLSAHGFLRWECSSCYQAAYRRADS